MNLDKDDLLRNAVPGYIFLIVILSFYAITSRLDAIQEVPKGLMFLVAGYPLGFIIQAMYRIIFHVGTGEKKTMEQRGVDKFGEVITTAIHYRVNKSPVSDAKAVSQWLAISLNQEKNRPFRERINFLLSYMHALGATCLAVAGALAFMWFFKIQYFGFCIFQTFIDTTETLVPLNSVPMIFYQLISYHCASDPQWQPCYPDIMFNEWSRDVWIFSICSIFWIFIGMTVYVGRRNVKMDAEKTRDIFIGLGIMDRDSGLYGINVD